jgi:hypothetical protein
VNWIHVTQDRDQWRAFVYTVMNLALHNLFFFSTLSRNTYSRLAEHGVGNAALDPLDWRLVRL